MFPGPNSSPSGSRRSNGQDSHSRSPTPNGDLFQTWRRIHGYEGLGFSFYFYKKQRSKAGYEFPGATQVHAPFNNASAPTDRLAGLSKTPKRTPVTRRLAPIRSITLACCRAQFPLPPPLPLALDFELLSILNLVRPGGGCGGRRQQY